MFYKYKVIDKDKKSIKGIVKCDDVKEIENILNGYDLDVICIKEYHVIHFNFINKVINDQRMIAFMKKVVGFLKVNVSLSQALRLILSSSNQKNLKSLILGILIDLNLGSSIVESIKNVCNLNNIKINSTVIEMLEILNATGDVVEVLENIVTYLTNKNDMSNKIKVATIYPKIVLTIGLVVLFLFMVLIVPSYKEMFVSMDVDIPKFTMLIFKLSDIFKNYFLLFIGAFILLILLLIIMKQTRVYYWIIFVLSKKVELIKKINAVKYCSTMALLMENQIGLIKALKYTKNVMNNYYYSQKIELLIKRIKDGLSLTSSLWILSFLPDDMKDFIDISEKQGLLTDGFRDMECLYKEEVNILIKKTSVLIEPFLIVLVSLIVVVMMLVIFIPMLQVVDSSLMGGM